MQIRSKLVEWGILLSFFVLLGSGCGGDGPTLIITPAGPVTVQKGQTQQFTSNIAPTTWSVDGGDANGTIDAAGLYTPPTTLPVSAEAVVLANTNDGQEATAQVLLETGNQIAFDPNTRSQINDTPILTEVGGFVLAFGSSSNFDVREGSLKTATAWSNLDTKGTPDDESDDEVPTFYSEDLDFLGFSPEHEVFRGSFAAGFTIPGTFFLDAGLNPYFIGIQADLSAGDVFRVAFFRSSDNGNSFPNPIPILTPLSDETQAFADIAQDSSGVFHVVFNRSVLKDPDPDEFAISYARSGNGGDTWDVKFLTPFSADPADFAPSLALSESGALAACWIRVTDPGGSPTQSLQLVVSQDGGENFSNPIGFAIEATGASAPPTCDLGFDPTGRIYVVYPNGGNVGLARSDDNGGSFSLTTTANPTSANFPIPLPRLSVDNDGRVSVIWLAEEGSTGEPSAIGFSRSTDMGATFTGVPEIPLGQPDATVVVATGLRQDAAGRLYVEYLSNQNEPAPDGTTVDLFMIRAE